MTLQEKRIEAGLSQSGLAKASGISLRTIQALEQGRREIGKAQASIVLALADAVGCTVKDLLSER